MLKRMWLFLLVFVLMLNFSACGTTTAPQATQPQEELVTDAITLMDNDSITVRVLKIDPEAEEGYTVSFMVWNKTDIELNFVFDDFAVNDLLDGEYFQFAVKSGEKQLKRITIDSQKRQTLGLNKITKIDFLFYATDTEFRYDDNLFEENMTIYPLGEAAHVSYQHTPAQTDVVWLDNEYATVTYVEKYINETDFSLSLYLQNKTDKKLVYYVKNLTVNEYTISDSDSVTVPAGKQHYGTFLYYSAGMDPDMTIESLSAEVAIYDVEHFTDGPLTTVSVSY